MGSAEAKRMSQMDICLNCKRVTCPGACDLIFPKRRSKPRGESKLYTAFGEKGTMKDFAERYGITHNALYYRVETCGLSMEAAIRKDTPRERNKQVAEDMTARELAWHVGVSVPTVYGRLKQGWSAGEIVEFYGGRKR